MRALTLLLAAAAACGAPAGAEAPVSLAAPRTAIAGVSIDAGRDAPLAQIRAALTTRVGDEVDPSRLAADRVSLQHALAEHGYLAAEVDEPSVTRARTGAFVVFPVHAGPLFHVRDVTLTGRAARDAGVVTLDRGDVADAAGIARAKAGVATVVAARDHASVDEIVHVDRAAAAVDVELATR